MDKKYYLVSLTRTHKKDDALSLWRPDGRGYCWYQAWAGIYSANEAGYYSSSTVIMVPKDLTDPLMVTVIYEEEERVVLPNTAPVRKALGISFEKMEGLRRTCFMAGVIHSEPG